MTLETFKATLTESEPPKGISKLLTALWYEGKNDWNQAHIIAQDISTKDGSWVHAYLHRKEGDHGNAAYWYHRAGKPVAATSLQEEWDQIVSALLQT